MQTQKEWILEQLLSGRSITAKNMIDERGIQQGGTRIFELRWQGYDIRTEMIEVENRFGQTCHVALYTLIPGKLLFA